MKAWIKLRKIFAPSGLAPWVCGCDRHKNMPLPLLNLVAINQNMTPLAHFHGGGCSKSIVYRPTAMSTQNIHQINPLHNLFELSCKKRINKRIQEAFRERETFAKVADKHSWIWIVIRDLIFGPTPLSRFFVFFDVVIIPLMKQL